VSRPKRAAVKNVGIDIDIANILGSEISANIDISKRPSSTINVSSKNQSLIYIGLLIKLYSN